MRSSCARGRASPGPERCCSAIGHLHQVLHGVDEPAHRRVVVTLGRAADLSEAQRLQRLELLLARAGRGLHLGDHELCHQASGSSGTGLSLSPSSALSPSPAGSAASGFSKPSTSRTVRPRSSATSAGLRRPCSAATVAFTRLIGFWLPSDFDSTSWIPASSSTARTPPPAITPVPGEAGFRSTRPAPKTPVTWCGIVVPCFGTRKRFLRARSTPFWI